MSSYFLSFASDLYYLIRWPSLLLAIALLHTYLDSHVNVTIRQYLVRGSCHVSDPNKPCCNALLPRTSTMTRAQRFAAIASVSIFVYTLLYFSVIPFPLAGKETADQLITVVRLQLDCLHKVTERQVYSSLGGSSYPSGRTLWHL